MSNVSILKRSYEYAVKDAINKGWLKRLDTGGLFLTDRGIDQTLLSVNNFLKEVEETGKVVIKQPRSLAIAQYLDSYTKSYPNAVQAFINLYYFKTVSAQEAAEIISKRDSK